MSLQVQFCLSVNIERALSSCNCQV